MKDRPIFTIFTQQIKEKTCLYNIYEPKINRLHPWCNFITLCTEMSHPKQNLCFLRQNKIRNQIIYWKWIRIHSFFYSDYGSVLELRQILRIGSRQKIRIRIRKNKIKIIYYQDKAISFLKSKIFAIFLE